MKHALVIVAMLCLLAGCTARTEPPDVPTAEPFSYNSKVFYFVEDDRIQAVDTEGRIIAVDNPQAIVLPAGSQADDVEIFVAADGSATLTLDYSYSVAYTEPVRAAKEDAPRAFAQALLDNEMGHNIWDYTLKDIQIMAEKEGRIDFVMVYDLILAHDTREFAAEYSPFDEPYGEKAVLTDQKKTVTLLGTGKQWQSSEAISLGNKDWYERAMAAYDDFMPEDDQDVIFATEQTVYYAEKMFLSQNAVESDYLAKDETTLWAMDRQSGKKQMILAAQRDHDFYFQDYVGDNVYLSACIWLPDSDEFSEKVYLIDDKTRTVKLLQKSAFVVATTADAIYTVEYYDMRSMELFAIEKEQGRVRSICTFPGHYWYEFWHFTVKGETMYLYRDDSDACGDVLEIDLSTGDYQCYSEKR